MKFKMIWVGSEGGSDRQPSASEGALAGPECYGRVQYEQRGTEMVRREGLSNGRVKFTPIANFTARIASDIVCDDDAEHRRDFRIEAELAGQKVAFVVPAAEFSRMNWVVRELGPQAIIYPGQLQHARAAIQCLSTEVRRERIFTHLGWRKRSQRWIFLHSAGALGPTGSSGDCQVRLPSPVQNYCVCPPADADARVKAVRSSMRLLSVAPDRITLPLLSAVYRAPLGGVDFSLFLTGRTGTFKTALAALCQQHFGAAMDAHHLPANFASTANSVEELAFVAKDALLVVDDFAPTGGMGDRALYALAERLFRAAGNHQGRSRMEGCHQLWASRPPRALLFATGEDVPRGHSLRARLLIVELQPGEVDQKALSDCQHLGHAGVFATAMGAYLEWISTRYDHLQEALRARVIELRRRVCRAASVHVRLPTTLSELQAGLEIWLQFASEIGAITDSQRTQLQRRSESALDELSLLQTPYHLNSDPALRFLSLLHTALRRDGAHLADRVGQAPEFPERWGWRKSATQVWHPQGVRIGWLAGGEMFLDPVASFEVAQQMAGSERLPVSAQTLRHRLRDHGLLASVDAGRKMLLVRRTLEGVPRQVLHLKARDLMSFPSERSARGS